MDKAVSHVVEAQMDAGIDIGNDGEQRRVGFQTYVPQRMSGFAGVSKRRRGLEFEEFPELLAYLMRRFPQPDQEPAGRAGSAGRHQVSSISSRSPTRPRGFNRIADELGAFSERFMTAASPGIISTTMLNAHYDLHDAYLDAIAREMSKEYQAIHKAGLILQIDAPDLAMDRTMMYRDLSDSEFVKRCERHVAAINKGIEGIPRDRVRLHVCYGNWEGPHIHDIPLATILPALYTANVGALTIEFSNPRHAHEYAALKKHPLPPHMLLIPGVVETTSNFVEHPEVVARRIEEAVAAVGDRERVIASTDCGFGTFTKREWVIEPVVWLKLKAIRAGRRHRVAAAVGQESSVDCRPRAGPEQRLADIRWEEDHACYTNLARRRGMTVAALAIAAFAAAPALAQPAAVARPPGQDDRAARRRRPRRPGRPLHRPAARREVQAVVLHREPARAPPASSAPPRPPRPRRTATRSWSSPRPTSTWRS